jgi:Na+/melibiose symporter-like transporter
LKFFDKYARVEARKKAILLILRRWAMKEEIRGFLGLAGIIVVSTLATVFLKKFFNIPTSGALLCVFIAIMVMVIIALLVLDYAAYRAREKQSGIELRQKLVQQIFQTKRRNWLCWK